MWLRHHLLYTKRGRRRQALQALAPATGSGPRLSLQLTRLCDMRFPFVIAAVVSAAGFAACAPGVRVAATAPAPRAVVLDSAAMRPGRFDAGKMWTFDNPPLDYFQEAYAFRPDSAWLARARLGALRFATYCSASFVSPHGLVLTNHHCSRENTGGVMRPGENFDSTGFYAPTAADERRVPGLFVEQLLSVADVTARMDSALRGVTGDEALARARDQAIDALGERLTAAARGGTPAWPSGSETVARCDSTGDGRVPATLDILKSRIAALGAFSRGAPAEAAARRVATDIFGYANSVKAYEGQLAGLRDPVLLGRRRLGEAAFRTEIARRPPIAAQAALFDSIAAVEAGLTRIGGRIYAFLSSPSFGSSTLARASLAVQYADARAAGAPPERLKEIAERAAAIANRPAALERLLAAAQFQDLKRALGERDTLAAALFAGRTADQAAADLLSHTALSDSARVPALFQGDLAASGDAAFLFARRASRVVVPLRQEAARLSARADNLAARLARVRFDVYGKTLPPDATFTLRLADGVVRGYPYNGTRAVPFTTFYRMYRRHAAAGGRAPRGPPPPPQRPPPRP